MLSNRRFPDNNSQRRWGLNTWLLFLFGATVFLQNIKIANINFTLFDTIVFCSYFVFLIRYRTIPIVSRLYILAACLLAVAAILSSAFAIDAVISLEQATQWLFVLFLTVPLTVSLLSKGGQLSGLSRGILVGALIVCIMDAVIDSSYAPGGRYSGYMGDPQVTAFMAVLIIPLLLWEGISNRSLLVRVLLVIVVGMLVFIIVRTASRTAMVCLVLQSVAVGVWLLRSRPIVLTCALLVFGIILFAFSPSVYRAPSGDAFYAKALERSTKTFEGDSRLNGGRLALIQDWSAVVRDSPLLVGVGLDNYQLLPRVETKPHNTVLLYIVEGGVVFALLYVLIAFSPSVYAWFLLLRTRGTTPVFLNLFIPNLAYSSVIVISSLNTLAINRAFWVPYAVLLWGIARHRPLTPSARAGRAWR